MWDERPADWPVVRLRDLVTPIKRKSDGAEHPLMTISAKRGFLLQSEKYSRDMAGQSAERYILLREGEFAYNKGNSQTAPQGCVFSLDRPSALVPFVYYCFALGPQMDGGFARHAFKAGILNRELARYINSGVRNDGLLNLYADDFFRCSIALPPNSEQLAIAEVLQSVENHIDCTFNLMKSLADAKVAAMRELLTRGMRRDTAPLQPLPERWVLGRIAGDVVQIPTDWKLVRLTSVAKLESGHTPDRKRPDYWDGDIPWLSLGDTNGLGGLTVGETAECVTQLGINNSSARVLPVDTVVFSRTATVGKSTRLAVPMATSQDFANWVCGTKLSPRYLVQVFRHMSREWDRLQEGSTHQTIYMPVFKKLQILLPPMVEQEKIADAGEAFDLRIEAEQRKLDELTNVRAALAQELLSGRLRLPASMVARFSNTQASLEVANA
ncbi:MAG: restriction endonuclease subunit S [Sphingopyxis sp.]|nr:restriction endonuclease subunit S [Sphingopyxis sp.]